MQRLLAVLASLPMLGCGSLIGNPGKTDTGTTASTSYIRTIDYDLPSAVTGYSLAGDSADQAQGNNDGLFQASMQRMEGAIDRVNKQIARLNTDAVNGVGQFKGKGPNGKTHVVVTQLTGGAYDLQAVVCEDATPFNLVQWSSVTGSVHSIRKHSVDPLEPGRASPLTSELTYTAGTTATLNAKLYLENALVLPPGLSGSKMAELIISSRTNGNYQMSGIHNWLDDPATVTDDGDEYFIGTFNEAGAGETIGYNKARKDACAATFDEAARAWCTGKNLNNTSYDKTAIAAAEVRMAGIPVVSRAALSIPVFPADITCP